MPSLWFGGEVPGSGSHDPMFKVFVQLLHLFIYPFDKYRWHKCYGPGTVLGFKATEMKKWKNKPTGAQSSGELTQDPWHEQVIQNPGQVHHPWFPLTDETMCFC